MRLLVFVFLLAAEAPAETPAGLAENAQRFLTDLIRLDTTNPPGGETKVAEYLKQAAGRANIPAELIGGDPARLNFVARIKGSGKQRPLLLMAHSDVVPADRTQWTVDPFAAELKGGFLYGRGAQDDKSLLAAELAVFLELKRRGISLNRDVILLSEADEEAGSSGITWLIKNAWNRIDAEFALNEGGASLEPQPGKRLFQIQTSEKIPTRVYLKARGTAGHGSLPRPDNPVVHLARAIAKLADADQPVRLTTTTRRYFQEMAKLQQYAWIRPLLSRLETDADSAAAASSMRAHDPEMEAMLRTTVSPTMLEAGMKINVIPNTAQAQIDVRRLPNETREEMETRFRAIINDPAVEVGRDNGQEMPATEPSSLTTPLYLAMESVFRKAVPGSVVVPYMSRGATDGSYLRQKGMAVYGIPLFIRQGTESRAHGNDERLSPANLATGVALLWDVVLAAAQ